MGTSAAPSSIWRAARMWRESIRRQGKVFSNYGAGKLASIHPRDIAAVAVRALTTDGHEGKTYHLTGPEALSIGEEVAVLSNVLGRRIEHVPITDQTARKEMERAGMPVFLIDALLPFAAFVRSGKAAEVFPTVREVTGRPPLRFLDWAREHAESFQ